MCVVIAIILVFLLPSSSVVFAQASNFEDGIDSTTHFNSVGGDDSGTTENEIPVFPSTAVTTSRPTGHHHHSSHPGYSRPGNLFVGGFNPSHHHVGSHGGRHGSSSFTTNNNNDITNSYSFERDHLEDPRDHKKKRLLKFLRHFRLDFTKFDTTCLKREGRGLAAPPVSHARITKYTRRRNRARPRNHYAMALYECVEGYEFPQESSDRMFCSRNKWVGPTPVCLPKGSLDESECSKCEQICTAETHPSSSSYVTCSCYAGYQMLTNGSCTDIDECSNDNGGCSGICFNKQGSFQCFCPSGYQVGPDGKTCIDRNECLLRNGHGPCQDTCENTPGSYLCSCERIPGTRLSADKHSCEDINECEEKDNFGCSHMCLNTFGNAFCACPKGLTLSTDDYKTCIGELTDAEPPSPPTDITTLATTTPIPTTIEPEELESVSQSEEVDAPPPPPPPENLELQNFILDCPPGSAPASDNSRICVEHEDCTVDNGGCEHLCVPSGSFRFCTCRAGYELLNETACVDQNECDLENGGCDQECVNLPGSNYCACKDGYKLMDDLKTCQVTFCEPPPIKENTVGWECEYPSLVAFVNGDKPIVGTKCKLRCVPGFSLMSPNDQHHNRFLNSIFGNPDDNSLTLAHHQTITCAEDGQWKGYEQTSKSVCISTSCPRLPAPEHGTLFPDTCLGDNVPLNSQCLVLCSSGFYPKNGRIRTCSRGFQWFPEDNPLCIKLPPTPRPYIHCPSDIDVDLKPGQASAYVKIPQPQANMDWYRYVEAVPPWAKNLEWDAPPGITQVSFIARSPISNDTATCHFKIHVVDREAPRVHGCPTSFEIRLAPGEGSREIWWSEPKFSDNVKLQYVQQSHSPGHALSRGNHHISYIAGDAEGNKARCSFTVTVHGTEDYEMADYAYQGGPNSSNLHMVICPNLKTGRWTIHYAYYLPPGCRYSTSHGIYSKLFKQKPYSNAIPRLRRRTLPH